MTEFLLARSLWWDGRMRTGEALRVSGERAAESGNRPTGERFVAGPVPLAEIPPGAPRRHFPGTLLPGILDAHVHSGRIDLAGRRAGGVGSVWDLGSVPERVSALARRPELPHIR